MDRINAEDFVDIGGGRRGFRDEDLAAGIVGTVLDAAWSNGVQEEIAGLIEALGLAPDAGNLAQLRQALSRWFGGASRVVTTNTVLTADDAGLVLAAAGAGNVALTLPLAAAANGRALRLTIARTDTSANALTLSAGGGDTLNGVTGAQPLPVGATVTLLSDGVGAWRLVASVGLGLQQYYSSNTAIVVPWWARRLEAEVWGAGGGGGYGGGAGAGGGGSGGAWGHGQFAVAPGVTLALTIGAAGAGGTSSAVNGGDGGVTSVGSLLVAGGGGGGVSVASGGGAGGATAPAPPTGDHSYAGRGGEAGFVSGTVYIGGRGGFVANSNGWAYGGRGGVNGNAGQPGYSGMIRLVWSP